MDWAREMTARWVRILGAAGAGRVPLDEAVRQVNAVVGPTAAPRTLGWRRRRAAAQADEVTVLSRQLVAGVVVSDLLLGRVCAVTGQDREQVLAELAGDVPGLREGQFRALEAELSGGCAALRDSGRVSYSGLGTRIEDLLRLAEEQATELVNAARAEAARITAEATIRAQDHAESPGGPPRRE